MIPKFAYKYQNSLSFAIGALLAGMISFVPMIDIRPEPYYNVQVTKSALEDGKMVVVANFVKNDECTFEALRVYGSYLGEWEPLKWVDPKGFKGDRFVGNQTLTLYVDTGSIQFDAIEIRTRHKCRGEKVDKVFTSFKYN